MEKVELLEWVKNHLSVIFEHNTITEKDIISSFNRYKTKIHGNNIPIYFFDWIDMAVNGDKKSLAFIEHYQKTISSLWSLVEPSIHKNLKSKIRNSIMTTSEYPSYRDSLAELYLIEFLIRNDGYDCIGVDFKLGNGKNIDIAFKKKNMSAVQLIEISNIHHLKGKDLTEEIRKRIEDKLRSKIKNTEDLKSYFSNKFPEHDITLSILPFIWEDYIFLDSNNYIDIKNLVESIGDDILPPITLLCEETNENSFVYRVELLDYVLERCRNT